MEMASLPLQIKAEPKILPREPSFSRSTSQPYPTQAPSQPEVPWESVTLNRCLFIAITILVLTSGIQRLHEALHGHKVSTDNEDKYGLIMRRSGALRHRTEPETTLWELVFSWLPDLDDEDDDDDDEDEDDVEDGYVKITKRKPKRRRLVKTLGGLRNRPLLDKKLLKQRDEKPKGRQVKRSALKTEDFEEADAFSGKDERVKKVEPKKSAVEKRNKEI